MFREVRQNHAIEHATISLLIGKGNKPPLAGYSTNQGFLIYGDVSTIDVTRAAEEALLRIQNGEKTLAISPYCGTNIVTGTVVSAIVAGLVMGRSSRKVLKLPMLAMGLAASIYLRHPIGSVIQRQFTTLADVHGVFIDNVRRIKLGRHIIHVFATSQSNSAG